MSFAMVSILHDDISVTWLVPSDEAAEEVLQTAFGDRAVRDGNAWRIEPYASRKAVFIPAIIKILDSTGNTEVPKLRPASTVSGIRFDAGDFANHFDITEHTLENYSQKLLNTYRAKCGTCVPIGTADI